MRSQAATRRGPRVGGRMLWAGILVMMGSLSTTTGGDLPHLAPDLFPVTLHATPDHAPIVLVENGQAVATICVLDVPEAPGRLHAFRHALDELQTAIELTTGARLPVVHGEIREPAIILGNGPAAAAAGLIGTDMPREGFTIMTAPNRVYIVGHDDPRWELHNAPGAHNAGPSKPFAGTAWGVFEFLERFVGVRWYWSTETTFTSRRDEQLHVFPSGRSVMPRADLAVPSVHLSDHPHFPMRGPGHPGHPRYNLQRLHAAQRLENTHEISITVHAPYHWGGIPEIRDRYPEVFELKADGTRDEQLLCYSHPKTLEVYLAEIARVYDEGHAVDPRRIGIAADAITVSPWDAYPTCRCDRCQAGIDREASGMGRFSPIIFGFTARLAEVVKDRWPGKQVIVIAYHNYREAPQGIEFPDNVEVQIADHTGEAWLKEPNHREWHQQNLERWVELTGRPVQIWGYTMYPAGRARGAAFEYPFILQDYYQTNRDRLVGAFINADEQYRRRFHVTAYVWSRLLWNPDIDVGATLDEYARRMYGPAGDAVREMLQIRIDGWAESRARDHRIGNPEDLYRDNGYSVERMERLRELRQEARRQVAGDQLLAWRLRFFEEPLDVFFREYDRIVWGRGARGLDVRLVDEEPVIDGRLDEAVWKDAAPRTLRARGSDPTAYADWRWIYGEADARHPTLVRAVRTADSLVIGVHAFEPDTDALHTRPAPSPPRTAWTGQEWYEQDAVEIILNVTGPGRDMDSLFHVIVNADGIVTEPDRADAPRQTEGLAAATHVGEGFWSVEIRIPMAALLAYHPESLPPAAGVAWYGQVARLRHPRGKRDGVREQQKLNNYYHTGRYDSRNMADFGPIRFVE